MKQCGDDQIEVLALGSFRNQRGNLQKVVDIRLLGRTLAALVDVPPSSRVGRARLLRDTEARILVNEHIAEDGPTVFAHACQLGAEGIVSKKVDGTYRSGLCPVWMKVRNPASSPVQRERSEIWNRRTSGSARGR
jgi:hypothetical protein